jgi:hypothetical protein
VPRAKQDLSLIRHAVLEIDDEQLREFFLCAFFAIVRRVSVAFDGEVRPHVNKKKKQRDAFSAFAKKVADMIDRAGMMTMLAESIDAADAIAVQGDNRSLETVKGVMEPYDVSLSHPPYLNCFDYLPVFKLEFLWADGVPGISPVGDYKTLRKQEIRAWPATSQEAQADYFHNQRVVYSELRSVMRRGCIVGIVIGDATVHKQLIRVHETMVAILSEVGFTPQRIIYRTTHYGTGKYSYDHRADYHSNDELEHWARLDDDSGKRDALIIAKAD